jgi:hypothetical protein
MTGAQTDHDARRWLQRLLARGHNIRRLSMLSDALVKDFTRRGGLAAKTGSPINAC